MKNKLLLLTLMLLFSCGLTAQKKASYSVFFETAQHHLTDQAQVQLDQVADELLPLHLSEYKVVVEAHTDDRGTNDYNQQLAQRRADAVRNYLTNIGIKVEFTTLLAFGEENPAFDNESETGRQQNRRVDVKITYRIPDNLEELFAQWAEDQLQRFEFDPMKAMKLIGEQGTVIWLEANSLVDENGHLPKGKVSFHLREAYAMDDIIMANLTTTSKDQILETGGMVFTEAFDEAGNQLHIRQGNQMVVSMPTEEMEEGMELFMGQQSPDGRLEDWIPTQQPAMASLDAYLELPPKPKPPVLIQMPVYVKYVSDTQESEAKPLAPKMPYKPGHPNLPTPENTKYDASFLENVFMSKAKKAEKDKAAYEKAMSTYRSEMKVYEQRMVKYEAAMMKYDEAYAQYEEDLAEWQKKKPAPGKRMVYQDVEAQKENQRLREEFDARKAAYVPRLNAWKEFRNEKMIAFEARFASSGNVRMNQNFLNEYIFEVNDLGWINCDRFYEVPLAMKESMWIADLDLSDEQVFVVFKDIRSMMRAGKYQNYYKTNKIPTGMNVRVIGIKLEDGKPLLAVKDTQVGQENQLVLQYESCSLSQLRESLSQLN
ncbi:MAG: OmpA family protein [Saprospiraceae bacterium]|nr:OmpA family protein [Saprospiraceae bacterium]